MLASPVGAMNAPGMTSDYYINIESLLELILEGKSILVFEGRWLKEPAKPLQRVHPALYPILYMTVDRYHQELLPVNKMKATIFASLLELSSRG